MSDNKDLAREPGNRSANSRPNGSRPTVKDGVLMLRIPKQAHVRPRRVTVQAG